MRGNVIKRSFFEAFAGRLAMLVWYVVIGQSALYRTALR